MENRTAAARERHPVQDLADRMHRRRTVCRRRGFCGPFINEGYYEAFGHGWEGYGDCAECGDTVLVEPHRTRQTKVTEAR